MRIFKENQIAEMVQLLKQDEVLAVPTDTVYGLCSRSSSLRAMEKLKEVKDRDPRKIFPIMCSSIQQASSLVNIDERSLKIMKRFMPGPLTIILKTRDDIPQHLITDNKTLAIRIAPKGVLQQVLQQLNEPVFMTSANQSGQAVCTCWQQVEQRCPLAAGVLEGEPLGNQASTVLDATNDELVIQRDGKISLSMIENACQNNSK